MKVLVIGHCYLLKTNRNKWLEFSRIQNVELFLVLPHRWSDYIRNIRGVERDRREPYPIHLVRVIFPGKETFYFFSSLGTFLKKIQPDIIYVEQGAYALVYFQTLIHKLIFSPHSRAGFFTWVNLDYKLKLPVALVEKFNFYHSDFAVTGNEEAKNILRKRGFAKPIKILPQLGVDPLLYKKFDVGKLRQSLELNTFTIGYVGRFDYEKGVHILIHAFSRIRKGKLLVIGYGKYQHKFKEIIRKLNIEDRVIFLPTQPMDELPLYYNCMDVLVLPSLTALTWKEQFGHVLIEAMACEVPVIGSTSGEIPNVIGDAGLIFEEGNVEDLYQKLMLLMENEQLGRELARKGRQRVLEKYTNKRIAEETYTFYEELLSR